MATVLVTGGGGFIGSHLVDALVARGDRVHIFDNFSSGSKHNINDGAIVHEIDIRDKSATLLEGSLVRPEIIYHLAAKASLVASNESPSNSAETNVGGTISIIEMSEELKAPIVFASSAAVYGPPSLEPTSEKGELSPIAPYGVSKLSAELYLRSSRKRSMLPHSICRLANIYGPRQRPDSEGGVVAILSKKLIKEETPVLYGHGKAIRDYVFILDAVEALLRAERVGITVNIGTGKATSVETVYAFLEKLSGRSIAAEYKDLRPGEVESCVLDASKARQKLNWKAETPIERGLKATYDFFVSESKAGV